MKRILSIQSHVVFGCAGNSAAVFPMRRMGMEVWPINTVQFSNHTQYQQGWKGIAMPAGHISELVDGLSAIEATYGCDAVLSGYLGSAAQGQEIITAVQKIKQDNPNAIYFCDPVMGHPEKGCIVAPEVTTFFKESALASADIIAPNLLELESLTGMTINTLDQVIEANNQLLEKGVKMVVVKHLSRAGIKKDRFEMLLTTKEGSYHISRPLYDFDAKRQPVGAGDLISGVMLANLMAGYSPIDALERTNAAVDSVMKETFNRGAYELQLIASQEHFNTPEITEKAEKVA
ncbi:pyridoxal kinase PdxY [Aliivibrio sp. S3MY1]|uniref:pyridoxal kinase PdxY n=1 Tax=unclassified Aliivibrio TaxID=2645654 RepID=UPI002378C118|nr:MULTISPECIES: pyridoxal kinase PdxY [unclassified Aliivibrio]MDD9196113.1 pyridoxal kinase PdxY [Aliivibrio sp. S3MY1]MDD9199524.1 pyridoxal kinase PdxY [Aliivibrio sp. S2MY1]